MNKEKLYVSFRFLIMLFGMVLMSLELDYKAIIGIIVFIWGNNMAMRISIVQQISTLMGGS